YAFERYCRTSALFGTPESCARRVEQLRAIGVNEIACLIDFGVDAKIVLASLESLDSLRRQFHAPPAPAPISTTHARATIHGLIESQAEKTPDSIAVIFENQTLTYRELDARADQIASRLHALNVGPEVTVGLFLERP